ncbi:hypothetical protein QJ48_22215 [Paenibacillus sp. A3]|uniref:hypothetical protein n=1 Tax=Paenibacillus sp. A3 TaxID=1337054 RepID=UPI0006D546BA|nr:hypothetical protein [Paenibacillus sp. A3]KPV57417.1 hypothetical protein QJ48_22215 [Paenibacillus sp. A3]
MKWEEIAELHPSRFVLVEAIKASSSNRVRNLEDMAVIQDYDNPKEAWSGYTDLLDQIGVHIDFIHVKSQKNVRCGLNKRNMLRTNHS